MDMTSRHGFRDDRQGNCKRRFEPDTFSCAWQGDRRGTAFRWPELRFGK